MDKKKMMIITASIVIILLLLICLFFFVLNKKCTVTFETFAGITTQIVKKGDVAKEPEKPTREGFLFIGWYYADNQNIKYDFSSIVDKDIKLIAKWQKENGDITKVSISASKNTLEVDEELELNINIEPKNVSLDGKNIFWKSSDETVATVDENGKVKALKEGSTIITLEVDGIKATITINVNGKQEETSTQEETKKSDTKKNTNTNNNNKTSKQTEDKQEETKPEITYKAVWGDKLPNDIAGQYYLYIESSEGKKVSGTAVVKYKGGKTKTETIPANGLAIIKSAVESISNVKEN